jgi:NADH-quinone oxidoreductase subunit J
MLLSQYLFFFLSFVAIISAILMVLDSNPVHSVLFLVVTFFAIAGHYLLLNAQFLAAVHIIVYAGAIMVLFLYVIMMLNLNKEIEPHKEQIPKVIAALAAGMLLISLVYAVQGVEEEMMMPLRNSNVGLVQNLGMSLYKEYMLPFEISAVLFLSAMVGAVFLSKKDLNQ